MKKSQNMKIKIPNKLKHQFKLKKNKPRSKNGKEKEETIIEMNKEAKIKNISIKLKVNLMLKPFKK